MLAFGVGTSLPEYTKGSVWLKKDVEVEEEEEEEEEGNEHE